MTAVRRSGIVALAGALALAIAAVILNTPALAPGAFNWAEPGNVAAALAQGRGFSDPFGGGTGPTAWVPPLPVALEASVFLAFGVKTAASAKALVVISTCGLAAANALLVFALRRSATPLAIIASAVFVGLSIGLSDGPMRVLSEAWLDLLLSAALLWAALEVGGESRHGASRVLVVASAAAALTDAGLALAALVVAAALAFAARDEAFVRRAALAAGAAAVLSAGAWTARNAAVFHRLVPLKSNFWFELHLANVASADGLPRAETVLHSLPFFDAGQFERYSSLGEIKYVDSFRAPTIAAIAAAPSHFAANIGRRLANALIFCRHDGGAVLTRGHFDAGDLQLLAGAGLLLPAGAPDRAFWTRIDMPPVRARVAVGALHLADPDGVWRNWAACRLDYDAQFGGMTNLGVGFLTAGVPTLALLLAALRGRGGLPRSARWAAVIGGAMALPYILVNHNDRHQLPLLAMQAVVMGTCVQAWVERPRKP